VNTVLDDLDDLRDWHGLDFHEALRRSFSVSGVMQHNKKRTPQCKLDFVLWSIITFI
jgi:hypothetical protein